MQNKRLKVQNLMNKIRVQLKENIKASKANKSFKMIIHSASQGYDKHFFDNLECDRISCWGKFEEMFHETRKLGEGCQSVIRKVIHAETKKAFAVKTFKKADLEWVSQMKPLFIFLRTLKCPTVMRPHWLFVSERTDTLRVIMDYIESPNLEQVISQRKTLSLQNTRQLIKILLQTVAYLHSKNACHRDIKPANILYDINETDKVLGFRLIDYQICKFSKTEIIEMWTDTGSLFYKAPEMFHGSYNEKIDVWSCGVIAYQLLHGHIPFSHEFTNQTIESICKDEIWDRIDSNLDYPTKLFIRNCLQKDPSKRPTAKEALQEPFLLEVDLKTVTLNKLTQTRSSSVLYKSKKEKLKNCKSVPKKNMYQNEKIEYCFIHQE